MYAVYSGILYDVPEIPVYFVHLVRTGQYTFYERSEILVFGIYNNFHLQKNLSKDTNNSKNEDRHFYRSSRVVVFSTIQLLDDNYAVELVVGLAELIGSAKVLLVDLVVSAASLDDVKNCIQTSLTKFLIGLS